MAFLSVKAKPELASSPLWENMPHKLYIASVITPDTKYGRRVRSKHVGRVNKILKKIKKYLKGLGFEIVTNGMDSDLKINIFLTYKDPRINRGVSMTDNRSHTSTIFININTTSKWPISNQLTHILLLHEIGHSLGLVVTKTESAERAGPTAILLNHCRHLTCAMTHTRLAGWLRLGWAFLFKGGQQTFCKHCVKYLKKRLS